MSKNNSKARSGAKVKKMTATDCAAAVALVFCVIAIGAVWFIMPGVVENANAEFDPRPAMFFALEINPIAYICLGFCAAYVFRKWLKKPIPKPIKLALLGLGLVCIAIWVVSVAIQNDKAYEFILYNPAIFVVPGVLLQLGTGRV